MAAISTGISIFTDFDHSLSWQFMLQLCIFAFSVTLVYHAVVLFPHWLLVNVSTVTLIYSAKSMATLIPFVLKLRLMFSAMKNSVDGWRLGGDEKWDVKKQNKIHINRVVQMALGKKKLHLIYYIFPKELEIIACLQH